MNISSTGTNLIKKYESCSLSVYADAAGYPTVGYGHKLSQNIYSNYKNQNLPTSIANKELKNSGLSYTSPITKSQANTLLNKDTATAVSKVNALSCISKLNQNQFDALVSLTYNVPKVLTSNDMIALLADNEIYDGFIGPITPELPAMITAAFQWTKVGNTQLNGLINRRNAEMELFCKNMRYFYNKIPNV